MSKQCPQEKTEIEEKKVTCTNCGEEGHRLRDCPAERQQRGKKDMDCRRCGGSKPTIPVYSR